MKAVQEACLAGIEAYERLVTLDPAARFEGRVDVEGPEVVVRGLARVDEAPEGGSRLVDDERGRFAGRARALPDETRGRLSALWLLAARATGRLSGSDGFPSHGRQDAIPQRLNLAVAAPLFRAALAFTVAGEEQEALFSMRRATRDCFGDAETWREAHPNVRLPDDLVAKATAPLLARASRATKLEEKIGDFEGSGIALAKIVVPFAGDADPLVRHDAAAYLTWAASSIVNTNAAGFAAQVGSAFNRLLDDGIPYVQEEALAAAEFVAKALANQAESWRDSHKRRLKAVAALRPLARKLGERGVNRDRQARRLELDGTPSVPPEGSENGPWAKEVVEARKILAERGR